MTSKDVADAIKLGLKKGYKENILLTSSYTDFIEEVREYLLTVNVAQQLLEWNTDHTYNIRIEYSVLEFYSNTFPSSVTKVNVIFNMVEIARMSGHSPTDKKYQKIDIAITEVQSGATVSEHERSKVGIELKGINKRDNDIINDAKRLANAMILEDKAVGANSIEFCFCGFLLRLDDNEQIIIQAEIPPLIQNQKNHWKTICNDLNTKYKTLNFSVELFKIAITPMEAIARYHHLAESDSSAVANDTGVVIGCILKIERKTNTGSGTGDIEEDRMQE